MKLNAILETVTNKVRTSLEFHGDWTQRVFFESYLKDEHKGWLEKGLSKHHNLRGEATVDLTGDGAYINRIDAYPKNQKFGSELLELILAELSKRGFKTARTYIESSNPDSKLLFKKFKFRESENKEHGSYWEKKL